MGNPESKGGPAGLGYYGDMRQMRGGVLRIDLRAAVPTRTKPARGTPREVLLAWERTLHAVSKCWRD